MNYLENGTSELIEIMGDPTEILTYYYLAKDTSPEDMTLELEDSWGLQPRSTLNIQEELLSIDEVKGRVIYLSEPIVGEYQEGEALVSNQTVPSVPVPRFKRITYEILEFIRKVRVPRYTVVNYGSLVKHFDEEFFVVGIDPGDASYALTLREINANVTIKRPTRKQGSTDWGSTIEDETQYTEVKAYLQHNLADLPFVQGLGNVPTGSLLAIIPRIYQVQYEDKVIDQEDVYKVVGFNRYTNKNLLTLILNIDASK